VAGAGAGYWNGGISLSVPVFDGGATHGQLLKAYASRRAAKYRYEDLVEQISLDIRKALLNLSDASKAVETSRKGLDLALEGRRLAKVGYENGVNTQLDVLEADNALVQAKFGHLQAIFGHIMAREALYKAMGVAGLLEGRGVPPAKRSGDGKGGAKDREEKKPDGEDAGKKPEGSDARNAAGDGGEKAGAPKEKDEAGDGGK
jgi:hypothetical protein